MFWFKKKLRVYPSVYSEWLQEFNRMKVFYFSQQDAEMLKNGCLKDSKYSLNYLKKELLHFLENQISLFFCDFSKAIQENIESSNSEYLLLVIRRYVLNYKRLFFFENLDFLPLEYTKKISKEINGKLQLFLKDVLEYLNKNYLYSASMYYVALNIQRIIET